MKCVYCGAHVATGSAFMLTEGTLHANGTFTMDTVVGAVCAACYDPDTTHAWKLPLTINVT